MTAGAKRCSKCGQDKPRSEFYVAHKATPTRKEKLAAKCKPCENSRERPNVITQPKINRTRARHRAVAELIERHQDEFDSLYERHLGEAAEEAEALAKESAAREHYRNEPVRLRPGKRRSGQKAGDRIDVARCPHCIKHHDRGHVCVKCGTAPQGGTTRRDDGVLDEIAIERAMRGERVTLTTPERVEAARRLVDSGTAKGANDLAKRLHVSGMRSRELWAGVTMWEETA